jgi:hypothetical protein
MAFIFFLMMLFVLLAFTPLIPPIPPEWIQLSAPVQTTDPTAPGMQTNLMYS